MKKLPVLLLILTIGSISFLHAQDEAAPAESASTPAQRAIADVAKKQHPFRGTVATVDASAGSLTIASKKSGKSKTYALATNAPLTREGKAITMADVKVGDYIRGLAVETAPQTYAINSGKVGEKSAEEKAADAKKKAAKAAKASASQDDKSDSDKPDAE